MGVKEEAKRVAKHTSVYGLGNILGQAIGFVLLPVYTRYLTPADYGIMALLAITTNIVGTIIAVGITQAMFRYYYEYEDPRERNQVISTGIISFALFALVSLSLFSLGSRTFARVILGSEEYTRFFLICFATVWFSTLTRMGMDYLRIKEWSHVYLVISLASLVTSLSLNIYFVVVAEKGVWGILLGNLLNSILFAGVLMAPILIMTGFKFSMPKCKEMVRFGAPLILSDVGRTIANSSDRYFIKGFGDLRITGIYSLAYRFGTIAHTFVTSPFIQIWFPRRLASYKEEDAEKTYARLFTYFLCILILIGLGICVVIKDIVRLFTTPPFYETYKYVPLIIFAYVIFSFYYHFSIALYIKKKSKHIATIDASTGFLNLALNFLLIKYFLVWGAVAATILSFTYRVTMTAIVGKRMHPIQLEKVRTLQLVFSAALVYFISTMIDTGSVWINIPLKAFSVILYPVFLWVLGFFQEEETVVLRQAWSRFHAKVFLRGPSSA